MIYEIRVSYPMEFYPLYDTRIETLAGKWAAASGVSLIPPGTRDLVFSFDDESPAQELVEILHRSKLKDLVISLVLRD